MKDNLPARKIKPRIIKEKKIVLSKKVFTEKKVGSEPGNCRQWSTSLKSRGLPILYRFEPAIFRACRSAFFGRKTPSLLEKWRVGLTARLSGRLRRQMSDLRRTPGTNPPTLNLRNNPDCGLPQKAQTTQRYGKKSSRNEIRIVASPRSQGLDRKRSVRRIRSRPCGGRFPRFGRWRRSRRACPCGT